MKITTLSRYGLRAAIDLALNYNNKRFISLKEIGKRQNISARYLENIMTNLIRNNLVVSQKGKFGGFKLAKSPAHITAADIIAALEPDKDLISCVKEEFICERGYLCASQQVWKEANDALWKVFEKYTLKELAEKEKEILKTKG